MFIRMIKSIMCEINVVAPIMYDSWKLKSSVLGGMISLYHTGPVPCMTGVQVAIFAFMKSLKIYWRSYVASGDSVPSRLTFLIPA